MERRDVLLLMGKGVLGIAAGALGLRCIRVCFVNNSPRAEAARTYNQGVHKQEGGWDLLQDARAAFDREEWSAAAGRYNEAHIEFYLAKNEYETAIEAAEDANCDALAEDARRNAKYCSYMEDACESFSAAAERYGSGASDEGDRSREKANEFLEKAVEVTSVRVPEEKDPNNPGC